ncbi:MAG TPA: hypothetical protein VM450_11695, partial [Thermomicrobiales bacterium]|nr:hypothetical protein [Thermomicrobiales bacterium]
DQQQDTTTTAGAAAGTSPATDAGTTPKPDSANKLIKDFAKAEGLSVEELLDQYKTLRDANRTERERLDAELTTHKTEAETLRQQLRDAVASNVVRDSAAKAGAISPSIVYRAIKDDLQFDKNGNPTNVDEVLASLKADEPQLFRAAQGSGDGGKGGASPNGLDINGVLRRMAERA